MKTRVSSAKKEIIIDDDQPVVLIGERINLAGRKKFQEALSKQSSVSLLNGLIKIQGRKQAFSIISTNSRL